MTRAMDRLLWPALGATTALFLLWGFAPHASVFSSTLSEARLVALASVVKLVLLAAGAAWSARTRALLDDGNPVRPAWTLLALGLLCDVLGQAALAPYQLSGQPTPFPSVADVFYLLAYPLTGVALVRFVATYREAGYPMGSRRQQAILMTVTAVAGAALAVGALRPVLLAQMPPLDKALSAAYPVLDLALLVPLALVVRTTWEFRGGSVGTAWLVIVSGIVFMCAGDVLFAYFTALGLTGLDPFVHAAFVVAYGLIAAGVRRHLKLVEA
jgi:hypothetical protein